MRVGPYEISTYVSHDFGLDGGAMFGSVPKVLWEKRIPADEKNRVPLVSRILILESSTHKIIVEMGCGEKWSEKERDIFNFSARSSRPLHKVLEGVSDVILTHLHFDHAGGLSYLDENQELKLSFPDAKYYLQATHWDYVKNPVQREKASFLKENIEPLNQVDLRLSTNGQQILPNIRVWELSGHTRGMQWVEVFDESNTLVFPADLIPTAHHLPTPYVMGYDICAERTFLEKEAFLTQAVSDDWTLVFAHDLNTAAAKVGRSSSGRFEVAELVPIPEITA